MKSKQRLSFSNSRFSALLNLSNCVIHKGDFARADFSEAKIRRSRFGAVDFTESRFTVECDLNESSFADDVSFYKARFELAVISGVKFGKKADFKQVVFARPKDTRFDSDLTQASFLGTDLSRVRFGSHTVWGDASDPAPYDVREFKKNLQTRLADALSVLRDLRDNYEYHLDYEGAGKLFVQEMDMKRQYRDTEEGAELLSGYRQRASLSWVYRVLCMYGESFRRPALLMLLVGASSFAFFCTDTMFVHDGTCKQAGSEKWLYALTRTLSGLFQWGCQALPDYVLRAVSIPIIGTMFVALRRRFERRFRH